MFHEYQTVALGHKCGSSSLMRELLSVPNSSVVRFRESNTPLKYHENREKPRQARTTINPLRSLTSKRSQRIGCPRGSSCLGALFFLSCAASTSTAVRRTAAGTQVPRRQ